LGFFIFVNVSIVKQFTSLGLSALYLLQDFIELLSVRVFSFNPAAFITYNVLLLQPRDGTDLFHGRMLANILAHLMLATFWLGIGDVDSNDLDCIDLSI